MVLAALPLYDPQTEISGADATPIPIVMRISTQQYEHYLIFRGSGGDLVPDISFSGTGGPIYVESPKSNTLSNTLNEVGDAFGLNRTELAAVCGASSRKTLYNWISGKTEPHRKNYVRVYDLLVIARDWVNLGYNVSNSDLRQPIVRAQSVLDILCHESLDRDLILFAGSRLALGIKSDQAIQDPFA